MNQEQLKKYQTICDEARAKSQPPLTAVTKAYRRANDILEASLTRSLARLSSSSMRAVKVSR